jgi:hypothetical protein
MNEEQQKRLDALRGAASGFKPPEYPVLAADRICRFEIVKATKEPLKEDSSKSQEEQRKFLVLRLKTTKDYPGEDGKPLRAGFLAFKRVGLYEIHDDPKQRDRSIEKQILPELGELLRCVGLGQRDPVDLYLDPAPTFLERCIVDMKTSIQPEKDGFPKSNGLKFVPPA